MQIKLLTTCFQREIQHRGDAPPHGFEIVSVASLPQDTGGTVGLNFVLGFPLIKPFDLESTIHDVTLFGLFYA